MTSQLSQSLEPVAHKAKSLFLKRLPAEIRCKIYENLFNGGEYPTGSIFDVSEVLDYDLWYAKVAKSRSQERIKSILQVCKQIRSQATWSFQSLVKITYQEDTPYAIRSSRKVGVFDPKSLKRIEVGCLWFRPRDTKVWQSEFPPLQRLSFHFFEDNGDNTPEFFTVDLSRTDTSTDQPEGTSSYSLMFEAVLESQMLYWSNAAEWVNGFHKHYSPGLDVCFCTPVIFIGTKGDRRAQRDDGVSWRFHLVSCQANTVLALNHETHEANH